MNDHARERSAESRSIAQSGEPPTATEQSRAVVPDDRLLRTRELLPVLGICRATLGAMVRNGDFPKPLKQGAHCRWLRSDADRYLRARLAETEARAVAC
jgi:predicted DNA-binding transcriptional regulator AlpA